MTPFSDDSLSPRPLTAEEVNAWRAKPAYLAAREFGIDMEMLEFIQTLSDAERIERNDRFAALVSAARASYPLPTHDHDA